MQHGSDRTSVREIPGGQTRTAFPAMSGLRTGLPERGFVTTVDEQLRPRGYRLVGVFAEGERDARAVAGFRVVDNLAWGPHLYVDDLVTSPSHRGRGHGRALLDWLADEARAVGAHQLHLDSGVGRERAAAHRLYLNAGYVITSHHFARSAADEDRPPPAAPPEARTAPGTSPGAGRRSRR